MYELHYDYIKNKYGTKLRLFTDRLIYEIKTENVYENFGRDKEIFDFSNYSAKSKYYDDSNKSVVGKIKDEMGGVAIEEFVALKPKIYSFLVDHSSEHNKAKEVNKQELLQE